MAVTMVVRIACAQLMFLCKLVLSCSAAFNLKVIHPFNSANIMEASLISGSTAERGELEKHANNDGFYSVRGWPCIPLLERLMVFEV